MNVKPRDPQAVKARSLAHYDQLIAMANSMPKMDAPDAQHIMLKYGIGWGSADCAHCAEYKMIEYSKPNAIGHHPARLTCGLCPLLTADGCCDGLWVEMNDAPDWLTFGSRAREIKKYIEQRG